MKEPILTKNRQVKHCPPHFIKVTVTPGKKDRDFGVALQGISPELDKEALVRNWLHENIENRFYIGRYNDLENDFFVEALVAAFEEPKDATYFGLALPSIIS